MEEIEIDEIIAENTSTNLRRSRGGRKKKLIRSDLFENFGVTIIY